MNEIPFEAIAFLISLSALIYGIAGIVRYDVPTYFKLPVAAVGCYVTEELWVLVNTLFGSYGSFVSVRLFGIFGFFCFLLCSNRGGADDLLDGKSEENKKARIYGAVAALLLFAAVGALSVVKFYGQPFLTLLSTVVFLPAFFAAYYNTKHLFLKEDEVGFLRCIRGYDVICLVIYAVNLIYLFRFSERLVVITYIADVVLATLIFVMVAVGIEGGKRWKTFL